jgi:Cd2+/Zn2+-exporting ATPase
MQQKSLRERFMNDALREYRITGLDCADCAARLEESLQKHPDLKNARVNIVKQTIRLDPAYLQEAEKIVRRDEPELEILDDEAESTANPSVSRKELTDILRIILGLAGFFSLLFFGDGLRRVFPSHLVFAAALGLYIFIGMPALRKSLLNIIRGKFFDEYFLMSIATIGAMIIGKLDEAIAVMLFYTLGEYLQGKALSVSRTRVQNLLDSRPETVQLPDGTIVNAKDVPIGSEFVLKPGEKAAWTVIFLRGAAQPIFLCSAVNPSLSSSP